MSHVLQPKSRPIDVGPPSILVCIYTHSISFDTQKLKEKVPTNVFIYKTNRKARATYGRSRRLDSLHPQGFLQCIVLEKLPNFLTFRLYISLIGGSYLSSQNFTGLVLVDKKDDRVFNMVVYSASVWIGLEHHIHSPVILSYIGSSSNRVHANLGF